MIDRITPCTTLGILRIHARRIDQESAKKSRIFIRVLLCPVSTLGDPLVHFLLMLVKHLVQIRFRGMNQLSVALGKPSGWVTPNTVGV